MAVAADASDASDALDSLNDWGSARPVGKAAFKRRICFRIAWTRSVWDRTLEVSGRDSLFFEEPDM